MRQQKIITKKWGNVANNPENWNAALHFLGVLFGLFAVPVLIFSTLNNNLLSAVNVVVYGCCFLIVFTFSTLFHFATAQKKRRLFKKLDRISIYFLIAGTYTPFVQFYVANDIGFLLLTVLWSLVVIGVLFEINFPEKYEWVSLVFYLFMGLLFLFTPTHFFAAMPGEVVRLIIAGVVFYVAGVYFYMSHRWKYNHALWHLFVLTASIFHFIAVYFSMSKP
jgi:hemolysin III